MNTVVYVYQILGDFIVKINVGIAMEHLVMMELRELEFAYVIHLNMDQNASFVPVLMDYAILVQMELDYAHVVKVG
uniref:Uncharacterized protein n=1 Tax=Arcella intermedia TaxID=1963864 RepID=A0A6B2LTU1_9EUKA